MFYYVSSVEAEATMSSTARLKIGHLKSAGCSRKPEDHLTWGQSAIALTRSPVLDARSCEHSIVLLTITSKVFVSVFEELGSLPIVIEHPKVFR
jgi:hypothetical protein